MEVLKAFFADLNTVGSICSIASLIIGIIVGRASKNVNQSMNNSNNSRQSVR